MHKWKLSSRNRWLHWRRTGMLHVPTFEYILINDIIKYIYNKTMTKISKVNLKFFFYCALCKKWQSETHTDIVEVDTFKAQLHNLGMFTMPKINQTDFILKLLIAFAIQ